ncbi:transcriptional regulator, SARP family [Streptomyces lincolnensis]|uniref:Transcriptional regulator, SARP family n=1 Tax=Streptomyces lincolnensis TaxID=1915 RepID=A0A1B1MNJ1_STRLN|nr:BTAD domain-containing putative transcriptional regulator [Streptomyces lincolnensis]ANS70169.1 transcriptional regulator, SARP family [Streptomyces lincolnensis]AXG59066.1 transcriptional regulator, SARP family [Streptomyces lincolnensis]
MEHGGGDFKLLGRIDARIDGVPVKIGRRRERLLLGLLLLDMGHAFPARRLIELLWTGEVVPTSARASLHAHVSRLRGLFQGIVADSQEPIIASEGAGYALHGDPQRVDVHRFRSLARRADLASSAAECTALLDRALGEWQGPVLGGDGPQELMDRLGSGLNDVYLSAVTLRAEARLALGQHSSLLEELAQLVQEHPHHERIALLRMGVLYRSGQRSEALSVYEETRARLAADLGLDPGPDLRRAQEMILLADGMPEEWPRGLFGARWRETVTVSAERSAHRTTAGAAPPVPFVPPSAAGFTGREAELHRILELSQGARHSVSAVAIVGAAGHGKTALALEWAHRHQGRYPGGLEIVDLQGYSARPVLSPAEVLRTLLTRRGIPPERIPHGMAELTSLYHSELAGSPSLLVLDNAVSAQQALALLPPAPGSLALVTSRNRLSNLLVTADVGMIQLGPLPPDDAHQLLRHVVGADRTEAEPRATAELAALCGHSPLALRIAAANMVMHPRCRIADHAQALRTDNRLGCLAITGDRGSSVGSSLALSVRRLEHEAQVFFRALGLLSAPVADRSALERLTGLPRARVSDLLDLLFAEHLVHVDGAGRFHLDELTWQYARLLAMDDTHTATGIGPCSLKKHINHLVCAADDG